MKEIELRCMGCLKKPNEIDEYIENAKNEGIIPDQYVLKEEGTLNKKNGHFLCTTCYISAGMPSRSGFGWKCP